MDIKTLSRLLLFLFCVLLILGCAGQIYTEKFGKNRLQFDKKKWHYIKTNFFDIYFTDSLDRMAEFVAFTAEEELPKLEKEIGYDLPKRVEIVLYPSFNDYLASNLGKTFDWQEADGLAPTINRKIALYYDGYQSKLAKQVRQGIINYLFRFYVYSDMQGDPSIDVQNQTVPAWLTTGYMAYKAENWSTVLDDKLRNLIVNADYQSFDQFYFNHPLLASHAFWYYVELTEGKEGPSSLMHFLDVTQNPSKAFNILYKSKQKVVKQTFMDYMNDLYLEEEEDRETSPDGDELIYEVEDLYTKYYNFVTHPDEDYTSYAYVRYKKGQTTVIFVDEDGDDNEIITLGYKFKRSLSFNNLPSLAWSNKGDQLAIAYPFEQKVKILLYDTEDRYKAKTFILDKVDAVQSMKYGFQDDRLIMSALRNGQTDIYVYQLNKSRLYQITNDPYDDLDPSPLLMSNKTAILYSSNRPQSGTTEDASKEQLTPTKNYNICIVDDWLKGTFRNINKITEIAEGNAFFPVQYNNHYFSFISDINGIYNRYLGRIFNINQKTRKISMIKGKPYIDLSSSEEEALLVTNNLTKPDTSYSIAYSRDSSLIFPISNYVSSIYESRTSGRSRKITQVYYEGDYKSAYVMPAEKGITELRVDDLQPSRYLKYRNEVGYNPTSIPTTYGVGVDSLANDILFIVPTYSSTLTIPRLGVAGTQVEENLFTYEAELSGTKTYKYKYRRFHTDATFGFETGLFTDRLQPYAGGAGPLFSSTGSSLGLNTQLSVTDIAEDYEVFLGYRMGLTSFNVSNPFGQFEFTLGFNNFRRRVDWGISYRLSQRRMNDIYGNYARQNPSIEVPLKQQTYYWDINLIYPLDVLRSIRLKTQLRNEQYIYLSNIRVSAINPDYPVEAKSRSTIISRLEWVYDNAFVKAVNISEGLKYKVYLDWIVPFDDNTDFAARGNIDPNIINVGADVRYYYPVYKDFTIAARLGIDMSFGDKKILYYLGGSGGWFLPRFNTLIRPSTDEQYSYQALTLNLRGYEQNAMNGNSAMALNFEARIPSSTFTNRYIKSLFLRNLQLIVFTDLGTAWNDLSKISRPVYIATEPGNPISLTKTAGGIGPFIGGYGAGIRMKLLGQYIKFDVAWNFDSFFEIDPIYYFAFGFDF